MKLLIPWLMVAIGGALGALTRFGIAELTVRLHASSIPNLGRGFPIATLLANLVGCFLIGVLLGSGRADSSESLRYGFGVGFLGALTTFSTFSAETITEIHNGHWAAAISYLLISLTGGLVLVVLGIVLGRKWFG